MDSPESAALHPGYLLKLRHQEATHAFERIRTLRDSDAILTALV